MNMNNTVMAAGMALALGAAAPAQAVTLAAELEFKGVITLLDPSGNFVRNFSSVEEPNYQGWRTPVEGSMVLSIDLLDPLLGGPVISGEAEVTPFTFLGQRAAATGITFESIPLIPGLPIPGSLLLGNMGFDFGQFVEGIPVSIVLEVGGFTEALRTAQPGDVLRGFLRGASEDTLTPDGHTVPVGPALVVTTSWNTTPVDGNGDGVAAGMGDNPSGGLPLVDDTAIDGTNGQTGIGGNPMGAGPFAGFYANFEFTEITVQDMGIALLPGNQTVFLGNTLGGRQFNLGLFDGGVERTGLLDSVLDGVLGTLGVNLGSLGTQSISQFIGGVNVGGSANTSLLGGGGLLGLAGSRLDGATRGLFTFLGL